MIKTKYKQTEVGEIPEDWNVEPSSEVLEIISGGTPKTSIKKYWDGNTPWLSVVDFNNGQKKVYESEKSITDLGLANSSTNILKEGMLIISARGTVGALSQLGKDMAFNQSCYGLNAKDDITTNDYLYYALKSRIKSIQQRTHGSVFSTITRNTFNDILLPVPSIDEQQQIASVLSSLDNKIELNRKMNKTLEEIGKAIFKRWFIDFEFPNVEGKPYKSSEGRMIDSELGEIPEGWEIKSLDKIANFLNGIASQKYPPIDGSCLPVIKIAELHNGITENSDKASLLVNSEYIVKNGDILFSWSGSLEIVLWSGGNGILNQHLFKVTSENYPKWFYYYWTLKYLPFFREIASNKATTMGHIQRRHLSESIALVPPLNILKKMNFVMAPLLDKQMRNNIKINSLSQIRDSLLPRLMSGKLRVI